MLTTGAGMAAPETPPRDHCVLSDGIEGIWSVLPPETPIGRAVTGPLEASIAALPPAMARNYPVSPEPFASSQLRSTAESVGSRRDAHADGTPNDSRL